MTEQEQSKEPQTENVEVPETETEMEEKEEQAEESSPAEYSAYEELNKRYLRLLADFDNFKRRTAGEK